MQEREQVQVRSLPDGLKHAAVIRASEGRVLEMELLEPSAECGVGTPAELESHEAIYLGMIERRQNGRLWLSVEHLLDYGSLEALRSAWREPEGPEPEPEGAGREPKGAELGFKAID